MELSTLTSLIAKLKTHDELPYLEAKINMNESEKIAQTLSALANSASYLGEEYGYMIWGIQDETWDVVGSSFSMEKAKATTKNGFQKGAMWISNALSNRADYSEYEFTIELQRIYVIRIKNCGALPLRYHEIAYIRKHSSNQKLSDYPEMEQIIRQKSLKDYSAEICQGVDISSLDTEAIRIARAGYEIKHPKSSKKQLSDAGFLEDIGLIYSDTEITNAAIILLGREPTILRYLHRHHVFFEYRSIAEKIGYDERRTWQKPVFLMLDDIWNVIDRYNTLTQYSEGISGRQNIYSINESVVKELVINALIHQDWRLPGQVDIRLTPKHISVISPGGFPVGVTLENLLSVRSTPRNQRLADAADKLNLMERSGQGMDLIYTETIREGKGAPNYARSDSFTVYAEVPILVEDMNFIKYIAHISEDQQKLLSVHEYVFLEGLRTGNAPKNGKADIQKLLDMGLIEGIGNTRGKRWILSQKYHEDHHILGKYTEVKGLERDEYKAMILKHIKENGRGFKKDIIFHNKTPRWVSNILTELKKDGKIIFRGPSKGGYWISNEINQK